ncbi:hypothetical protein BIZ37_24945 [Photobacterium sp. BZF1]|uniref:hypothetical protein n=1 Tax=Photobacterium sp. BZF1 TaxID=1904457 RepID=UPI001653C59B|nr:hypothetical protein [Photobacterium sp. BZF1]MBC7005812.1 hypothetical protein [Photobacterium sp. BZF1]
MNETKKKKTTPMIAGYFIIIKLMIYWLIVMIGVELPILFLQANWSGNLKNLALPCYLTDAQKKPHSWLSEA